MKMAAIGFARGGGQPRRTWSPSVSGPRVTVQGNHRPTQRTGAPEAADWTEAETENDAAENTAAENAATESDTEMTASGTAPPMTS
jgi:hypothetical protein